MLRNRHLKLCQRIVDAGGQPYVVGGWVRDKIMGRNPKDVDIVVVGLDPEGLEAALEAADPVGKGFPVYIKDGVEWALARTDKKVGAGHDGFECDTVNVTLEEDLRRRDLRINAMAMDPFTGKLFDPFGGTDDLQKGVLRPVGPHFAEDPLRVLRAARFAAQLNMVVSDELVLAAIDVHDELFDLTPDRVWGELLKALQSHHPRLFFEALDKMMALEAVFPELVDLRGRVQPEQYHPEGDAYKHTLLVLERARALGADDETMFAVLTHDFGKAVTPDDNLPHHYDHERLGVPLVKEMCDRLRVPNGFRAVAVAVTREHLNVHRFDIMKPVKRVRLLMRLGVVHNDVLLRRVGLACQADAQGRGPESIVEPYPNREALVQAAAVVRTVRGTLFAHLKDGRKIAQRMENERAKALKDHE